MTSKKIKIVLILLALPVLYFIWEFLVLYVIDSYCKSVADKLPVGQQLVQVSSPTKQTALGAESNSKYYQVKWDCEDRLSIPTPLLNYINSRFPK